MQPTMRSFIITLLLFAASVSAQKSFSQNSWKWSKLHGPNTGDASHKLMSGPHNEIIAQDFLGYYHTSDNGKTWEYETVVKRYHEPNRHIDDIYFPFAEMGISQSGVYYFAFAHEDNDSVNDALEGIYRSTDFGVTWKHVVTIHNVYQFYIANDNSLVLVTDPTPGFLRTAFVYESIDNGSSWTNITSFDMLDDPHFVIGKNKNGIFFRAELRSASDERIEKFDFEKQSFFPFSSGMPKIYHLYFGVTADDMLLAFTDSIIFTSDGINTWDSIGTNYNLTLPVMGNGDTIVGQGFNRYGLQYYYLTMSTDRGHTWDSIGNFGGPNSLSAGATFNYGNPNELLAENYDAIFVSTDRGGSWKEIGLPYANIDNVLLYGGKIFTRSTLYSPWYSFSFCRSEDYGDHWIKMDSFNFVQIGKGIGGNIIAIAPDTSGTHYNTWTLDTAALNWTQKSYSGDITYSSFPLNHVSVTSDEKKYLYVSANDKAYRSEDSGLTWVQLIPGYIFDEIYDIALNSDSTVYLSASPPFFRSDDHGDSWNLLDAVNDPVNQHCVKAFGPSGVLLGTDGSGLLRSSDKGKTWMRIDKNNFDTVTCIGIDTKGNIATGTNHGLWLFDNSKQSVVENYIRRRCKSLHRQH
jgi:photosystem II stability/assembly factor-like uncharacterized protein